MLANILKNSFRKIGFDISRYDARRDPSACVLRLLQREQVEIVVDVGANTGQYGKTLRETGFGGEIVSFEPLIDAHRTLEQNARGDNNWIVAPRCAIGASEGTTEINVSENSVSSSILDIADIHVSAAPDSKYVNKEETTVETLNRVLPKFCHGGKRCHLKIDTQGYEKHVVDGASEVWGTVYSVEMEVSLVEMYEGSWLFDEAVTKMSELGYRLFNVFPFFSDRDTGQVYQMDVVFVRNI